jgi:tRNA (mo5U34)-methyltransferase
MTVLMETLQNAAAALGSGSWQPELAARLEQRGAQLRHRDGNVRRLLGRLAEAPRLQPSRLDLAAGRVVIGAPEDLGAWPQAALHDLLMAFRPWRKGPLRLFGIDVDSEWRSDLKWNRFKDHIAPLAGRRILDIGSSCGYYLFRMAAHQPDLALGLEPYPPFFCQYLLLQGWLRQPRVHCLPLKLEELPAMDGRFDTVFHMGVLYHQRSPHDALNRLASLLRPGGELVLETLVLDGEDDLALCPRNRYAKMGNVFFLPTVPLLMTWLQRAGFQRVRCLDKSWTTAEEQRRTPWINTESLADFLHPADARRTVEGYQAPLRAVLLAERR